MHFTITNTARLKKKRKDLRKKQTDVEKLLWLNLRNKQLNSIKFYRQYSIGPYILDFFCYEQKLAVELDGGQHSENDQSIYDEKRTQYLNRYGITLLRFWNNEVIINLDGVLDRISSFIIQRPLTPSFEEGELEVSKSL